MDRLQIAFNPYIWVLTRTKSSCSDDLQPKASCSTILSCLKDFFGDTFFNYQADRVNIGGNVRRRNDKSLHTESKCG